MKYLKILGTIFMEEIIVLKASAVSCKVLVLSGAAQANREKQSIMHKM